VRSRSRFCLQFKAKHSLPYPLLADVDGTLRKGFGIEADLFGILPGRETFVISKEGRCLLAYRSQMDAASHIAKALEAVRTAKA